MSYELWGKMAARVSHLMCEIPSRIPLPSVWVGMDYARIPHKVGDLFRSMIFEPSDEDTLAPSKWDAFSRRGFFERLHTFRVSCWSNKPSELSPIVCARFGWVCTELDKVACPCCNAAIHFAEDCHPSSICSTYRQTIENGHNESCPWIENPCPVSFGLLPFHGKESTTNWFIQRLIRLQGIKVPENLPSPSLFSCQPSLSFASLKASVQSSLDRSYWTLILPESLQVLWLSALVTGWYPDRSGFWSCAYCNRVLWSNEDMSSIDGLVVEGSLNLRENHRAFCPWSPSSNSEFLLQTVNMHPSCIETSTSLNLDDATSNTCDIGHFRDSVLKIHHLFQRQQRDMEQGLHMMIESDLV